MFNTPPVLPIYSALMTLRYYKEMGGVAAMEKLDLEKAAMLYDAIDSSKMFVGTVNSEDRSIMNVCFVMKPEYADLDKEFIDFASSKLESKVTVQSAASVHLFTMPFPLRA